MLKINFVVGTTSLCFLVLPTTFWVKKTRTQFLTVFMATEQKCIKMTQWVKENKTARAILPITRDQIGGLLKAN